MPFSGHLHGVCLDS
uniref:Uncharacterized protein n=1 Tax=Anguilla anguilla TaxID=7936 RepID=A0A0E9VA29_ANGAN